MKKVVTFFLAVVAVAALAAWGTLAWTKKHAAENPVSAHAWLHRELQLTMDQREALAPIESAFAAKQRQLTNNLHEANARLADLMAEDKAYTPRVAAAVGKVNDCMAQLQQASIEHVFAMRAVLTPDQGDSLLALARQVLEQSP